MRELYRCVGCGRDLMRKQVRQRDWGHVRVSLCKGCVEDYGKQVKVNHGQENETNGES